MANALIIDESRRGRICIVALSGRVDSTNAEELTLRLKDLLGSGENPVVVDLSRVIYLTSAAFRALLIASHEAERNAVGFVLCSVPAQVRELFEMGGLLDAFTMHESREEALAKLA